MLFGCMANGKFIRFRLMEFATRYPQWDTANDVRPALARFVRLGYFKCVASKEHVLTRDGYALLQTIAPVHAKLAEEMKATTIPPYPEEFAVLTPFSLKDVKGKVKATGKRKKPVVVHDFDKIESDLQALRSTRDMMAKVNLNTDEVDAKIREGEGIIRRDKKMVDICAILDADPELVQMVLQRYAPPQSVVAISDIEAGADAILQAQDQPADLIPEPTDEFTDEDLLSLLPAKKQEILAAWEWSAEEFAGFMQFHPELVEKEDGTVCFRETDLTPEPSQRTKLEELATAVAARCFARRSTINTLAKTLARKEVEVRAAMDEFRSNFVQVNDMVFVSEEGKNLLVRVMDYNENDWERPPKVCTNRLTATQALQKMADQRCGTAVHAMVLRLVAKSGPSYDRIYHAVHEERGNVQTTKPFVTGILHDLKRGKLVREDGNSWFMLPDGEEILACQHSTK